METENNAVFLLAAPVAVEATIDAIAAGSLTAIRYWATNPVCRTKAAELAIKSVATAAVALGIDVTTNHPEGNPNTPIVTPPIITPIEAQKEFGVPPLEDKRGMGEWVDNILTGYPAEDVSKWAEDFVKIYPSDQQQNIKDQILLTVNNHTPRIDATTYYGKMLGVGGTQNCVEG